jgi:hypothetical protein
MKIYDLDSLGNALYEDLTWRLKEISDLKRTIELSPGTLKRAVLRSGIPLVYAHWEGHVKVCATAYVNYVASKRLRLHELKRGYALTALRSEIDQLAANHWAKLIQIEFLERVDSVGDLRFGKADQSIDTRSNLSFDVLQEICAVIGIAPKSFASEESFINKMLVERRNHIAHGREIAISESEFSEIADRTIALMRLFNSDVQYAALQESYRREAA